MKKKLAPMNRTLILQRGELNKYSKLLLKVKKKSDLHTLLNRTINQDLYSIAKFLPEKFVDLLFLDPPYNMHKKFKSTSFKERTIHEYADYVESFIVELLPCLKPDCTVYVCGDWKSSTSLHLILSKYFIVRNRITWEREKGRGAGANWKNNTEDIWFCTMSNNYKFNAEAVKLKRRVRAPYTDENGIPKDWQKNDQGAFRLTYASNIWNDISVPFWSMPENTEHPTQKPEKLLAKLILASTNEGDIVFDPFLGSGTSSVVAKKLHRNYVGIEIDRKYASLAEKRLELAEISKDIQGYSEEIFWERNSLPYRNSK